MDEILKAKLAAEDKAKLLIMLPDAYLCPEDHICASSVQCPCGSRNLISISAILNRTANSVDAALEMVREYKLLTEINSLPSMRREFGDN